VSAAAAAAAAAAEGVVRKEGKERGRRRRRRRRGVATSLSTKSWGSSTGVGERAQYVYLSSSSFWISTMTAFLRQASPDPCWLLSVRTWLACAVIAAWSSSSSALVVPLPLLPLRELESCSLFFFFSFFFSSSSLAEEGGVEVELVVGGSIGKSRSDKRKMEEKRVEGVW